MRRFDQQSQVWNSEDLEVILEKKIVMITTIY